MPAPVRILHLVGAMNVGGVETWLMQVLRSMDPKEFKMDYCCLSGERGAFAPEIEALGGHVFPYKVTNNLVAFKQWFRRLLREGKYRVVHSHVHHFSGTILHLAAQEGVPIRIAHSHTTRDGKKSTTVRKLYRALQQYRIRQEATAAVGASELAAAALFGQGWRSDSRCRIIRCGIDLSLFALPVDRSAVRQSLGLPEESKVIGYVGRFEVEKNCGFLLDIFKEALARRPDIRLLLVGDGSLRPGLEERIRELGLSAGVVLAGWRSDVAEVMIGAMDFFCLPSHYEGLGVAVVEAQAAGLPCLVSEGVPREAAIVPSLVSFLPRAAGAAAWAEVIDQKLGNHRMDPSTAGAAIRNKGFDVEQSLQALKHLYQPSGTFGEAG
ncbi:MAG: glycosyltransferase [Deltaproteobacteria bacterium]|nr:glycosyltransferase [Deltaproteobacteria bacterium]